MATFQTEVELGEEYIDDQTGFQGIATAIYFFQHACERVNLETYDAERKEIKEQVFDSPRLRHVKSIERIKTNKTGGPARERSVRPNGGMR